VGEDRGEGIRPHGFPLPNPLPQGEGTDPVPWDRVLHGAARFFSLSLWERVGERASANAKL